ncbi:phospholipid-transporting ATPase ABCA3 [Drosophila willistoni]|uniref:phospholipid-transporting ATPase ABCA3 n=1 Tax=Drosophila willistoni TaxID=7260 RepID=UPI001F08137E|nr:phospholipid-transporting ATPase ABCA3 [Drosophila willistoni]
MLCFCGRCWLCLYCFRKCEIFGLLVIKNFHKQTENKLTLLISIFLPVIFALTLVLNGYSIENEPEKKWIQYNAVPLDDSWKRLLEKINWRRNEMIREQSSFQSNVFVPQIIVGYAPNDTVAINRLVDVALGKLSLTGDQIAGFDSCETLRVRASADQYIASICFNYDKEKDESLPNGLPLQLKFSIVMPSEFRLYERTWLGSSWTMDRIYDNRHFFGQDNINENGDCTGYVREGFIPLQYYVSNTYLEMSAMTKAKPLPKVNLRRFDGNPNIVWLFDEGLDKLNVLALIVGFLFPVTLLAKQIVEERETGQNFGLQINNITMSMQKAAWYFNGICQLLITAIMLATMLKLKWNGQRAAIRKCPLDLIFLFFISYVISAMGFVILMSAIMRTTKMTVALVPICWLLTCLPFLSAQTFGSEWSNILFMLSTILLCNVLFSHGLIKLLRFEEFPTPLTTDQYLYSNIMWHEHTLIVVIGYFYVQTVIYILVALILNGTICPCLMNTLKGEYFRKLWHCWRRMVKKRQRKRRKARENVVRLRAAESRRISEITDNREQFTREIIFVPKDRTELKSASAVSISSAGTADTLVKQSDEKTVEGAAQGNRFWAWWDKFWEIPPPPPPQPPATNPNDEGRRTEYEKFQKYGIDTTTDKDNYSPDTDLNSSQVDDIFSSPIIEFSHVWKKYSKSYVLKNFSLKVFQDEVVVVLGHNASGKTTLMKILSGEIQPTIGKVYISGHNVEKHTTKAFSNVGMAIHHIDLFGEFTLANHLMYFCRLRGLRRRQSQTDVETYVQSLELEDIRDKPVKSLTSGQKQLLQTLCAFAGRTRIVLLDKPLEGVDEHKMRLFFNFVADQRADRTIFLTTNNPKVASNLADRVAILVKGYLHSFATEKSIFQRYKDAYRLMFHVKESCDTIKLKKYLTYHIPKIELESNLGNTFVYLIKFSDLINIVQLLEQLPTRLEDLQLVSYHLIESSLDIIMFNALTYEGVVGKEGRQYDAEHFRNSNRKSAFKTFASNTEVLESVAQKIRRIDETHLMIRKSQRLGGIRLILAHIGELLKKRFLVDIRHSVLPAFQVFLPIILAVWTLSEPYLRSARLVLPTTYFSLNQYEASSISLMQQNGPHTEPIDAAIQHYMKEPIVHQLAADIDLMEYIQNYISKNFMLTDMKFVVAAIFSNDEVEALFNFDLHRSAPLSLSLVMDALAVGYVSPESRIIVHKETLPYATIHKIALQSGLSTYDFVFKLTMCFCFCCIWALPMLNISLSRGYRYGRIELLAGMSQGTLMVATQIYGLLKVFAGLVPINAALIIFRYKLLMNVDNYLIYAYIVLSIVVCVLSINNFVTIWIMDVQLGYVLILIFYCSGILLYLLFYELKTLDADNFALIMLDLHPLYALMHNLFRMYKTSLTRKMCRDRQTFATSVYLELCKIQPNCCEIKLQNFQYSNYLLPTHLLILVMWFLFYIRLKWKCLKHKRKDEKLVRDSDPDSKYDQDILHLKERQDLENTWINEKSRVRTLERPNIKDKALHVENLGMFFGLRVVLKHINFMLERNQVMAILGRNGSGKTVLFKAILGIFPTPSSGHITSYHKGTYQLHEHEDYKHFGYSAQDDDIKDGLTVIEAFQLVLLIRGVKSAHVKREARTLCQVFDLYKFRFHSLTYCSRGVMKRLSIAIAMIGYAGLILLDEPFAYLDIISQRVLYYLIQNLCSHGRAVLYTCSDSHFVEPAHRCVTLNQFGRMEGIGERLQLQQNVAYSHYYQIEVRFNLRSVMQLVLALETNDYSQFDVSTIEPDDVNSIDIESELESESPDKEDWEIEFDDSVDSSIYQSSLDQPRWKSNNRLKYWMVYRLIENIFPHAIIKKMSYQTACFWLSSKQYSIPNTLVTLHKNRHTFYSYSITPPTTDSIYRNLTHTQSNRKPSDEGHFN